MTPQRLVVGISGASGFVYGVRLLQLLAELRVETHLVISRAADVTLKERRTLVLMARETPLTLAHLRNMTAVTEMGGIIAPPVPAFYARPQNLSQMIDHSLGRVLDLFGLDAGTALRWGEPTPASQDPARPFATPKELL